MNNYMAQFFSFSGRIDRRNFLFGVLVAFTLFVAIFAIRQILSFLPNPESGLVDHLYFFLMSSLKVFSIITLLSFITRRYHDMNFSGWWMSVTFIAQVLLFFVLRNWRIGWFLIGRMLGFCAPLLLCFTKPGTKGKNRYG
jgi:uncharacterized membrane protein YhaH (DUF805 family)